MDMGLGGMGGAAGAGDAMQTLFDQRMQAAKLAQQDQQFQQQQQQQDALTRLKFQEQADATRARVEAGKQAEADRVAAAKSLDTVRAENQVNLIAPDQEVPGSSVQAFGARGIDTGTRFAPTPIAPPAPPSSIAAPGQDQPEPMPGTIANSPAPGLVSFHRIPTAAELQHQKDEAAALAARPDPLRTHESERLFDIAHPIPKDTSAADTTRLDKSYDTQTKRLDAIEKPFADQAERIGRLRATLNQMTPQADALIAPELLTAMAGGAGSGLRMNEAEISRVVGGRNQWEDLKSRLDAWQADPTKPFAVTPEQRKQMRDLIKVIADRGQRRLALIDDVRSKLVDATDVTGHRRLVDGVKKALNAETSGTSTVKMRAPNGDVQDVPTDQVDHYKARGATVVR